MKAETRTSWRDALTVYFHPRPLTLLFLGFSSGLPLLLVFGTLSFWLREAGVDRSTIGFVSWVALAYGLKFFWSPLVDRLPLPLLGRLLGQRRSWMLLAQAGVILGLLKMSASDPLSQLQAVVLFAVVTAFSSATQDITIDAWRIEAIGDDYQGAMAGTYQLGYRLGMIIAGGGAFTLAHFFSWPLAYQVMAACMLIGVVTVLIISEPPHDTLQADRQTEQQMIERVSHELPLGGVWQRLRNWFIGAVVSPFAEFFARHGLFAFIILAFIMVFRISDITMGIMTNPLYVDVGYSDLQIGLVTKTIGPIITILGAIFGGMLVIR